MIEERLQAGALVEFVFDVVDSLRQVTGRGDGLQEFAFAERYPGLFSAGTVSVAAATMASSTCCRSGSASSDRATSRSASATSTSGLAPMPLPATGFDDNQTWS